jgi:hypothetical protein
MSLSPAAVPYRNALAEPPLSEALAAIPEDLGAPPALESKSRRAGIRFREWLPANTGSDIYHVVYLPSDWQPQRSYPVIVEYAGNTPANDPDKAIGRPEGCMLGYGLTAGSGAIWVCLPYVGADGKTYQKQWWGDEKATVAYCKQAIPAVCREYGGDPSRVVLAGFSRGSIACNFIGLHDDEIAKMWCGFICHSHYDGARPWNYEGSDTLSAAARLARLGERPQWISHEQSSTVSIELTKAFINEHLPTGNFTFVELPFPDHTPRWLYRDFPERQQLRSWYQSLVEK